MVWQDFVLSAASIYFGAAQLPTLLDSDSMVPRVTSVVTAIGLAVIAVTYWTLSLTFSAGGALFTAAVWAAIGTWRAPDVDDEDMVEMVIEDDN